MKIRTLHKCLAAALLSCGLALALGCDGSNDEVETEHAVVDLNFVGTLPAATIRPTGTTAEPKLEIEFTNLEEPEHDFYYVLWAVDTDGSLANPFLPMEAVTFNSPGSAHLHEADMVGATFGDVDQLLISIEEDTDDDGAPEVLNTAGVPQATGPTVAPLFSEDFAPGGVGAIVDEHMDVGDGLTDTPLESDDFESAGAHGEVHVDYIEDHATVHIEDTPLPPPGFHYALWVMPVTGGAPTELADVDLDDDDADGIGEAKLELNMEGYDLYSGLMFMVTLENNLGHEEISPAVVFKGTLPCVLGRCPDDGAPPDEPTGGGGGGGHSH